MRELDLMLFVLGMIVLLCLAAKMVWDRMRERKKIEARLQNQREIEDYFCEKLGPDYRAQFERECG